MSFGDLFLRWHVSVSVHDRRRFDLRAVFEGRHSRVGGVQYLCQIYGGCDRLTVTFALTRRGEIAKTQILMRPDRCDRRTGQIG